MKTSAETEHGQKTDVLDKKIAISNLSLKSKVFGGYFFVILFLAGMLVFSIIQVANINKVHNVDMSNRFNKTFLAEEIRSYQFKVRYALRGYLYYDDLSYMDELKDNINKHNECLNELEKDTLDNRGKQIIANIKAVDHRYNQVVQDILAANKAGGQKAVRVYIALPEYENLQKDMDKTYEEIIQYQKTRFNETRQEVSNKSLRLISMLIISGLILIIIAVIMALLLANNMTRPIVALKECLLLQKRFLPVFNKPVVISN